MTPERWQQVRGIYEHAAALGVNDRAQFLEEVCACDSELRCEVESLLGYGDRAGSVFLKAPAAELLGAAAAPAPLPSRIGRRIGVYQIIEEIGHGGMGEVYRAARVDGQYEKQVAIKLVRSGYDSGLVLERFRHERQILAGLDHPNIARLLDGGTTDEGIPYLVMELVEGLPMDEYCEYYDLGLAERLQLFMHVCSAVQYAHQRLVVHRDLKPSNILITVDGVPKLLDFGIAKILDPSAGAETTVIRPMTPEYASPEQIRGEPITTASDVYSLGVVLYRLLVGRSPYPVDVRNPTELARAISEIEPQRPSTATLRSATVPQDSPTANFGKTHRPSGAKLSRILKGDLDNIALKALRKEPERRYVSVDKLQEDIRRHLHALPVQAAPDSLLYRAGKFVRRNIVVVIAAALVLMAIFSAVSFSLRQARIAQQQRRRAEKRFDEVRELANSLIFEIHDSIKGLPGATATRKLLLDRAVQYLDKLSQDAAGDVNLQRELAWAYHRLATVQGDTTQSNLGQVKAAEASNRKSTALFEAAAKANPNNLSDQLNLAMAYRWRAFLDIYEPNGRAEIDRALAVTEPLIQTHEDDLDLKNELAQEYYIQAYIQDALGSRLQSIESFRKVLNLRYQIQHANPAYPDIRRELAKVTVMLAHEIGRFGSRDEGIRLMNTGIADFERLVNETGGDPGLIREVSTAKTRRADIELMRGDVPEARTDFHSARQLIDRLAKLDPDDKMLQSDIWVTEFEDARALAFAGRYAEALPALKRAFQGYQALHLEEDVGPGRPAMQSWIAEAEAGAGDLAAALKDYQAAARGLEEDEAHFDDARCDLAMVETKIGAVLLKMGKVQQARVHYRRALEKASLSVSLEKNDFPALYAAAEAYAGVGDIAAARARTVASKAARLKLWKDACSSYKTSLATWRHIPNPSRFSGNDYVAAGPQDIQNRLHACEATLVINQSSR